MSLLLILLVSAWYAWRYAKSEVDPDWALFNMAAFTGSWYGRDFLDCKTPAVHLWYYALAKIVGTDVKRVRFTHHFLVGSAGILVMYLTNSFWNGLAFTVFVNAPWLYAFHGNVGQVPALFMAVAIVSHDPILGVIMLGLAFFYEPKYLFSAIAIVFLKGMPWLYVALALGSPLLILVFLFRKHDWVKWTWEGSYTAAKRMGDLRVKYKWYNWAPWYTVDGLQYALPWIFMGALANPDWRFWLPAALYLLMIGLSRAIRQNHYLPLAAWVATAGIHPYAVLALVCWDLVCSGFLLGDIWDRHYGSLRANNINAREIGEWIRDKPGTLWVNDFHPAVYIYARKKFNYHLLEHLELNAASPERRELMKKKWETDPPDMVVLGPKNGVQFVGNGYSIVAKSGDNEYRVFRRYYA